MYASVTVVEIYGKFFLPLSLSMKSALFGGREQKTKHNQAHYLLAETCMVRMVADDRHLS